MLSSIGSAGGINEIDQMLSALELDYGWIHCISPGDGDDEDLVSSFLLFPYQFGLFVLNCLLLP